MRRGSARPAVSSVEVVTGPPASAAGGVDESAEEPETCEETARVRLRGEFALGEPPGEAQHEVQADQCEDQRHHRARRVGGESHEHGCAEKRPDGAGDADRAGGAPVHVAEARVGYAGGECGAQLRGVDDGGGSGRGDTGERDEHGGRGGAEAHAEAAVDKLRGKTCDCDEQQCFEFVHVRRLSRRRGIAWRRSARDL